MRNLILGLLLAAIFGYFVPAAQIRLRELLHGRPRLIWAVPFLLTGHLHGGRGGRGCLQSKPDPGGPGVLRRPGSLRGGAEGRISRPAFRSRLPRDRAALVPAGVRRRGRPGAAPRTGFSAQRGLWDRDPARADSLYRLPLLPGLKYNLPKGRRDLWLPLAGFALLAPVLILIGIPIGFLPPPHLPTRSAGAMAGAFGIIFAGTALPEEILFRSLIQNLLMLRFGATTRTLLLASFIFGCAHLDNGPQPVPNWRYMILATIAGVAYGRVFQRASTVISSAGLHTLVDWTKHFFF